MKLEPFDLEKALAGAKVVVGNPPRQKVRVVSIPENSEYPVLSISPDGETESYTERGWYFSSKVTPEFDLFLSTPEPKEVKQTMWMNVPAGEWTTAHGYLYASLEAATESVMVRIFSSIAEEVVVIRKVVE